jgi:hypothetical protein
VIDGVSAVLAITVCLLHAALQPPQLDGAQREALRDVVAAARAWAESDGPCEPPIVAGLDAATRTHLLRVRANEDPAIDGFVRRRLSEGLDDLGPLDDGAIRTLLANVPRPPPNPMADIERIRSVVRSSRRAASSSQQARFERGLEALEADTLEAERLRRPGDDLSTWIENHLRGPHRAAWLLARCIVLIEAGWPVSREKARITRLLGDHRGRVIEVEAWRPFVRAAQRAAGLERWRATGLAPRANGDLAIGRGRAFIDPADVNRWLGSLEAAIPRRPPDDREGGRRQVPPGARPFVNRWMQQYSGVLGPDPPGPNHPGPNHPGQPSLGTTGLVLYHGRVRRCSRRPRDPAGARLLPRALDRT